MWTETYSSVCRQHQDVVAAFESPHGRVALLLCQSLVPDPEATVQWCNAIARGARSVTTSLRAAGLTEDVTILQWCSFPQIAHVVAHWDCTYEGDERRHAQIVASIAAGSSRDGFTVPGASRAAISEE
jgi:hypothetical protein